VAHRRADTDLREVRPEDQRRVTTTDPNIEHGRSTAVKPTIVLVHGAFAESASWNDVIEPLASAGHTVIAAANPLRGLASDAASVADVVRSVEGPVVLAAHSYGGMVISNVPADSGDIVGLVYAAGFAPDAGEAATPLSMKFPGSTLGDALRPVPRADGTTDLYITQERFHEQFCADVPAAQAALMWATQRPATAEALSEPSGQPLWRDVPSWFVIAEEDRNIPAELQRFMAERAGARRIVSIPGASHAVGVSQPKAVADVILESAALVASA
jgi:pimeloyl-ACP methyl ester carboxylesterase